MRTIRAAIAIGVLLAACSDDASPSVVTSTSASTDPASTEPAVGNPIGSTSPSTPTTPAGSAPSTEAQSPIATQPPGEAAFGDPRVAFELVATFDSPVGTAVRPGDDALFIIEQDGRIVRWDRAGGVVVADLTDLTAAGGERGLLGLAFSVDGQLAWTNYTDGNGDTVVAEYPVAADGTFGVAMERMVLTVHQPYSNHNGGDLAVGPDGMLYIALGDGGSADDPERRASDPTSLLGKLLRVDPTPGQATAYSIPGDNPFAGGTLDGVAGAPEVWAWGLRNPWRIAFDPTTRDLWIADVGQNRFEEINFARPSDEHPAGWALDFGWSAFEAHTRFNGDVTDTGRDVKPVWTYEHGADGCSVSGGAVYRGSAIAGLAPAFVYGDYCSGRVWAFDAGSGRNVLLWDGLGQITSVRSGPDGELYVTDHAGPLLKMIAV